MRSIVKALATGVLVVPVVLGGAGSAFADGYDNDYDKDRDHGYGRDYDQGHDYDRDDNKGHDYDNGRDHDKDYGKDRGDGPSYKKVKNSATVWGGMESKTVSGFDEDGTAFFLKKHRLAGPEGAFGHKVAARS